MLSSKEIDYLQQVHMARPVSGWTKDHGRNFYGAGLGWFISDYYGEKVIEHNGGMPGYISKVALVPGKNSGFVILNNGEDSYVNNSIYYVLLDYLTRDSIANWVDEFKALKEKSDLRRDEQKKKRLESRIKDTQPSKKLNDYSGTYRDKMYGDAVIEKKVDQLFLTLLPAKKVFNGELEHWHYNTFKVEFKDPFLTYGLVTFYLDVNGKVNRFTIDLPVADFHFDNLDFYLVEK